MVGETELRFHVMIKHGMICPQAALKPSLVLCNHFFIIVSICFSVLLCNQWTFVKYTSKQPHTHTHTNLSLTLSIRCQNWMQITTSVIYVKFSTGKLLFFLIFYYFNFFPIIIPFSMPLSLRDLSLSSHLPGQLKCKVTLQMVLKSITGSHSFTAHVVLQMRGAEERHFQLYSLTLNLDKLGVEKQMFGAHSYT